MFVSDLSTKNKTVVLGDTIKHFDHFVQVVGIGREAAGSDFGRLADELIGELDSFDRIGDLWDVLIRNGYSAKDVEKISHKNELKVIKEYLDV